MIHTQKKVFLKKHFVFLILWGLLSLPGWGSFLVEEDFVEENQAASRRLILSLDGGGIRGVLEAMVLKYWEDSLEAEIKNYHPDEAPAPDIRLGECFDLIAGTSTGGIIALLMRCIDSDTQRPRFKMKDVLTLYKEKGEIIFPPTSVFKGWFKNKYSPLPLEALIKEYVEDETLKDLNRPTLITSYDVHKEGLHLFKSYDAHLPSCNYKLSGVARATSAAPTFFPAVNLKNEEGTAYQFSDGGLAANNPSLHAYLEAQKLYPNSLFEIISIGTGASYLFTIESKEKGGKLSWASDISSVLMSNSSQVLEGLMGDSATLRGDGYTRIHFDLDQKASSLDGTSPKNINILQGYVKREKNKPSSAVNTIKNLLLEFYESKQFYVFYPLIEKIEAELEKNPTELDLSQCYLTERKLWEVGDFLARSDIHLESLNLSHNSLSASTLKYLSIFEGLKTLTLDHTELTLEGLEELKTHDFSLESFSALGNPSLVSSFEEKDPAVLAHLLETYDHFDLATPLHFKLGRYYESQGEFEKALSCYQKQDSSLQLASAKLYLKDDSEVTDFEKGFEVLNNLSTNGDREAQYLFGHFYDFPAPDLLEYMHSCGLIEALPGNKEEVKKERLRKKVYWYKLAAEQNHKVAAKKLGALYEKEILKVSVPSGLVKDERHQLKEILKWYRIAYQAGSKSVFPKIEKLEVQLKNLEAS